MKAVELVEKNYPMVRKDERIKNVLNTMYKAKVDRVIVLKEADTLYGIATEWDIFYKLSRIRKEEDQPYDLPLSSVATYPVDTLEPETPLQTVIDYFLIKEYSSIPIVDTEIHGLVTKRGVISAYLDRLRKRKTEIFDIMAKAKGTIEPFKSIRNAENKLRLGGFSTLVVHENGKYIGVVTALDIAKEILRIRKTYPKKEWDAQISKLVVADVMRKDFATLTPEDKVGRAAEIFSGGIQKLIPIIDEDQKVLGVVTRRHVLREILNLMK